MPRRDATLQTLSLALNRIERGTPKKIAPGRKLSVMALAEEAGIHPSTIHTRYPAIAEKVRLEVNRGVRIQRDKKTAELQKMKNCNAALRKELNEARALISKIASENARLICENSELKAIQTSRKVLPIRG